MHGLIHVLPDAVANQIAAGEVIQRPASLIKELVENSVDSGADQIQVIIKDAGRTLVQVVDNGCGMNEMDARLCFERHATSKINQAEDLYTIRTMGFRGEALASIAAVAQVELRTKTRELTTGTRLVINGSEILLQEPAACADGTSIAVKNLFYNIPARRKFLKTNSAELRHILSEFQRIALANPDIRFHLYHNDSEVYHLPPDNLRERIAALFGKQMRANLISLNTDTPLVRISGFAGKSESARKTSGEQFLFVNQRYMRHGYFHKAIMSAYEKMIPEGSLPAYFIFFEIDPARIDVNVHPTKTEIKFEDETAIYQMLNSTVRESLGRFNITPSLDFNQEGAIDIPIMRPGVRFSAPEIRINSDYNPFKEGAGMAKPSPEAFSLPHPGFTDPDEPQPQLNMRLPDTPAGIQIKNKYILIPVKSGIMLIHQARAWERIIYEEFIHAPATQGHASQKFLFPETIELSRIDLEILEVVQPGLLELGFDIEPFGGNSIIIRALPEILSGQDPKSTLELLLEGIRSETLNLKSSLHETLARQLARLSSQNQHRALDEQERRFIIDRLFACREPQLTPEGKPVLTILQIEEIDKRFQ